MRRDRFLLSDLCLSDFIRLYVCLSASLRGCLCLFHSLPLNPIPSFSLSFSIKLHYVHMSVSISPQHRYIYSNYARDTKNASPPQGIVRLDLELGTESTWIGTPDEFLGEPLYAKRKNTSEFILLCYTLISSSFVSIFTPIFMVDFSLCSFYFLRYSSHFIYLSYHHFDFSFIYLTYLSLSLSLSRSRCC